jgi:shikimate dehydrogenase
MHYKLGLIGKKLSHSFSKKYFEEKFQKYQISNYSYNLWELESLNNIQEFILQQKNVLGFNVTIPYKVEILNYVDEIFDEVKYIGACNCVSINNSKWTAYNTDWWGFLKMIENKLQDFPDFAIILGTGGAAKAVKYALDKLQIKSIFVSRHPKNDDNVITYSQLHSQFFQQNVLLINTTPLGMYPDILSIPPIDLNLLNKNTFVIDLIYNPEKTLLLQEAEKKGCKILNGIEMLHLQAEKSWEIWQNSIK